MKIVFLLNSLLLLTLLTSCSDWEQTVELPQTNKPTSGRVVLIEDFTGASCPNCPAASAEIEKLLEKYPDNLIAMGVHSNFLGSPFKAGEVKLVTPDAQAIETFLGAWNGKPEAAINRKLFSGQPILRIGKPDTWSTYLEEELKLVPDVDLKIISNYDSVSRELIVQLTVIAKKNISEAIHLHVAITESNIINTQSNQGGAISNYVNNHVLRKLITPTVGDKISDSMKNGETLLKEYRYILPIDAILWRAENCTVVAFVSQDETKKYILQAAEAHVK
jgi:thiol-disulfide isomerase/thioredoxin